jgi:hypothetical protein
MRHEASGVDLMVAEFRTVQVLGYAPLGYQTRARQILSPVAPALKKAENGKERQAGLKSGLYTIEPRTIGARQG